MKAIRIMALVFVFYAVASKAISYFASHQSESQLATNGVEHLRQTISNMELNICLLWTITFTCNLAFFSYALYRKSEKLKNIFVFFTVLFALLMSITDNLEYSMYVSKIVIGTEIIN